MIERGAAVRRVTGTGVPVRGDDIDTDQIVPARFLKEVTFDRMGEYAFYDARRGADGELNDHPFNTFQGASVLVVNDNFGCGSSREHAPQALARWGVRAVVGESFAEIFADNCTAIGLPTVTVSGTAARELQDFVEDDPDAGIEVDVAEERVVYDGREVDAAVDPSTKEALVEGIWDTTAVMRTNLPETRDVARSLPYVEEHGDD
jgi:3-isopropylmalate/(R)-2-methylmalate dehydratase small subunit